jgi:hypothetical protein
MDPWQAAARQLRRQTSAEGLTQPSLISDLVDVSELGRVGNQQTCPIEVVGASAMSPPIALAASLPRSERTSRAQARSAGRCRDVHHLPGVKWRFAPIATRSVVLCNRPRSHADRARVAEAAERAASHYADGVCEFETVAAFATAEPGIVEISGSEPAWRHRWFRCAAGDHDLPPGGRRLADRTSAQTR